MEFKSMLTYWNLFEYIMKSSWYLLPATSGEKLEQGNWSVFISQYRSETDSDMELNSDFEWYSAFLI